MKLSIIIVNWNTCGLLRQCLRSVRAEFDARPEWEAAGHPRLRVMSLNDNMALFSAHSNDNGYEHVFAEQLATFVRPGDLVIAISASGNSPNVLNAVKLGRENGALTVGLCGYAGGRLAQLVDLSIIVPNYIIEQIEDIHLILEHMMTTALRRAISEHVTTMHRNGNHPDTRTGIAPVAHPSLRIAK